MFGSLVACSADANVGSAGRGDTDSGGSTADGGTQAPDAGCVTTSSGSVKPKVEPSPTPPVLDPARLVAAAG